MYLNMVLERIILKLLVLQTIGHFLQMYYLWAHAYQDFSLQMYQKMITAGCELLQSSLNGNETRTYSHMEILLML